MTRVSVLLAVLAVADATCTSIHRYPPHEFADNSACESIGLSDLTAFRYGSHFSASGLDAGDFFPYLASVSLTERQVQVTNAIVWVHGLIGNANKFFCDGVRAARDARALNFTLTIAPWFGSQKVEAGAWSSNLSSASSSTCWDRGRWLDGGDVYEKHLSSYTILDKFVALLQDKGHFPNLSHITVAGFSAGCQMVHRWAFFSDAAAATRLIVSDCGSYMYLDDKRPAASCSALSNTGTSHNCSSFHTPDAAACSDFAAYKYGLDFSSLERNSYVQPFAANASKLHAALRNFPRKDLRLILGLHDVCQCNVKSMRNDVSCYPYTSGRRRRRRRHGDDICRPSIFNGCCDTYPDAHSEDVVDHTCAAMLGGSNRLQRGLNYASYLNHKFTSHNYTMPVAFFQGAHNNTMWALGSHFALWAEWNLVPPNPVPPSPVRPKPSGGSLLTPVLLALGAVVLVTPCLIYLCCRRRRHSDNLASLVAEEA